MSMQHPEGQLPQTWRELAVWIRHARPAVRFRAIVFLLLVAKENEAFGYSYGLTLDEAEKYLTEMGEQQ